MAKMNILFLTEYFYPFAHGGSEWSTYYLTKGLLKRGFKIFILTPNFGTKNQEYWQSINIYRLPFPIKLNKKSPKAVNPFWFSNFIYQIFSVYWIVKMVIGNKIDAIHVQGNYFVPSAYISSLILKKPMIVTLRDYITLCPYGFCLSEKRNYRKCNISEYFRSEFNQFIEIYCKNTNYLKKILILFSSFRAKLLSSCLLFILKRLDKVVCISKKQEKIFNLNGLKNTVVIYNSFEKLENNKATTKDYLFFAGRLTPGKGANLLVKSFKNIVKSSPNLKLLIAGDGLLKDEIKSFINKNNLEKNIELLGQISHTQVLSYLKQAKVCIVPSVWEEPFGRIALEAQLLAVPTIVSNRGGLPEIITDRITGYVVKPNESSLTKAILKAMKNNSTIRRNIYKVYPSLLEKFHNKVIDSYINLYKSL